MKKIEVFTQELNQCYNLLSQQIIMIDELKKLVNKTKYTFTNNSEEIGTYIGHISFSLNLDEVENPSSMTATQIASLIGDRIIVASGELVMNNEYYYPYLLFANGTHLYVEMSHEGVYDNYMLPDDTRLNMYRSL